MANISGNLATWSQVEVSNQPDTTDANTIVADMRSMQVAVRTYLATRATIASGSTVDLSTVAALFASVTHSTGTTAISAFGTLSAGMWKVVTFAISGGTLSLTHNGTSMILPGAANITLADGESLLAESLGSGNWKVHIYQPTPESGTWTPVLSFGDGSTGITYSTQDGTYTKIADRVFIDITMVLSSKGSSTGAAEVSGLPFTATAYGFLACRYNSLGAAINAVPSALININSNSISLQKLVGGTTDVVNLTDTDFGDATDIIGSGLYRK